jgi:hypothetical protein
MKAALCTACKREGHYKTFCTYTKRKAIAKRSKKQIDYEEFKESELRPYLIKRDGNHCFCCARPARPNEKLDIEHTISKGSRPDLKRDPRNLTLMCRDCHRNKTDHIPCHHYGITYA